MSTPPPPSLTLPIAVTYRDASGPFAIDLVVTDCCGAAASALEPTITLTIGSGTLHDADKGVFALDGLELTIRAAHGRFEPVAVVNPGVLSEFQQEGVLDAVSSYLNGAQSPGTLRGEP